MASDRTKGCNPTLARSAFIKVTSFGASLAVLAGTGHSAVAGHARTGPIAPGLITMGTQAVKLNMTRKVIWFVKDRNL